MRDRIQAEHGQEDRGLSRVEGPALCRGGLAELTRSHLGLGDHGTPIYFRAPTQFSACPWLFTWLTGVALLPLGLGQLCAQDICCFTVRLLNEVRCTTPRVVDGLV